MKDIIRNTILMTVTCLLASGLLAAVFQITKPTIEENLRRREREALLEVAPDAETFEKLETDGSQIWIAKDADDNEVCRVIRTSERGYSSTIIMLISVGPDDRCISAAILQQNETPGLGTNIATDKFLGQFAGLSAAEAALRKDGGEIDSITAATISSRAVAKAARTGILILSTREETE